MFDVHWLGPWSDYFAYQIPYNYNTDPKILLVSATIHPYEVGNTCGLPTVVSGISLLGLAYTRLERLVEERVATTRITPERAPKPHVEIDCRSFLGPKTRRFNAKNRSIRVTYDRSMKHFSLGPVTRGARWSALSTPTRRAAACRAVATLLIGSLGGLKRAPLKRRQLAQMGGLRLPRPQQHPPRCYRVSTGCRGELLDGWLGDTGQTKERTRDGNVSGGGRHTPLSRPVSHYKHRDTLRVADIMAGMNLQQHKDLRRPRPFSRPFSSPGQAAM